MSLFTCLGGGRELLGQQIVVGHVVYDMRHQYHQAIAKEIVDYGKKMYGAKVIVLDGKAD